jgi:hypothetical protein
MGTAITPGLSTVIPTSGALPPEVAEANLKQTAAQTSAVKTKGDPNRFVDIVAAGQEGASSSAVAENLLAGTGSLTSNDAAQAFQQLAANINVASLSKASGAGEVGVEAMRLGSGAVALKDAGTMFASIKNLLDEQTLPATQNWQGSKALTLIEKLTTPSKHNISLKPELATKFAHALNIAKDLSSVAKTKEEETAEKNRIISGEIVIPDFNVVKAEAGFGGLFANMDNMDIEQLVILVMMDASRDNNEDLKAMMKEMKAVTETKKAIRAYSTWLHQVKATWDKAALKEYYKRQASGQSPPSETFAQFKEGLTLTLPTQSFKPNTTGDGSTIGGAPNYPSAEGVKWDFSEYKSPGEIQEANRQIAEAQGKAAASGAGVAPLDAATAIQKAKEYGVDPEDIQRFWSIYSVLKNDPAFKDKMGGDFDAWLKKPQGATVADGAGLAPGQNGKVSQANLGKVGEFCTKLEALDKARNAENTQKIADLKAELGSLDQIEAMSPADLSAFLTKKLNASTNAELKAYVNSLPPQGGSYADKVSKLVKDIVFNKTKVEHLKQEGKNSVGAEQDLQKSMEALNKLSALSGNDPALKLGTAALIQDDLAAAAKTLGDAFNNNSWTSGTGKNGREIAGGNVEAGSSGGVADHDPEHYDISVGGMGYVDKAAVGEVSKDLQNLAKDGNLGGFSLSGGKEAAKAGIQSQISALANADGTAKPSVYGSMASEWRAASEKMRTEGRPKFAGPGMEAGAENSAELRLVGAQMNGSNGISFGSEGRPYDIETRMRTMSSSELDAEIEASKGQLDSMSELSEEVSMRLQMKMDLKAKFATTLSNLLSKMSKTSETLTQNLK